MFRGAQQVTMDAKGRVMVPARMRQVLAAHTQQPIVVTIDVSEQCLLAYPMNAWESIEQALLALPNLDTTTRQLQRLILGHATEIDLDSQGRILIPSLLVDYAKLTKDVILLGQGNKFEIWDGDHWQKRRQAWLKNGMKNQDLTEVLKGVSL